ncbi:MAG: MBL fold metallo-hydrolase [Erysipelotrichaceae bacterium]|nr:MBL fold metallo-hydrolase [Erysipelotrichaceae bacterium]
MNKVRLYLTVIIALCFGFVSGFSAFSYTSFPKDHGDVYVSGNLKIHFLELGNANTGDCVLIQVGNTDVLIDAGSKKTSFETVNSYLDNNISDDIIEYVVVTHAHEDHYVNFTTEINIFTEYQVNNIIDFSMSNNVGKNMYNKYISQRDLETQNGANHYTAADCIKGENGGQKIFELGNGIELEILDNYYYYNESSSENNYSVCVIINQGDRHFLFTGDLEKDGEKSLVELNDLPEVELFKAGHHGSVTSSNEVLLSVIKPKIVVVCCCAGNNEYTNYASSQFPSQAFINRISIYTDKVYVTSIGAEGYVGEEGFASFNGNIVVTSSQKGLKVECSNNNTILKDTDWFKQYRMVPDAWKGA